MNEINISKELSEQLKTIPVTTPSAKHTFSSLRRLKIYLLAMSQPRLNHVTLHSQVKDKFDSIARKFILENERQLYF